MLNFVNDEVSARHENHITKLTVTLVECYIEFWELVSFGYSNIITGAQKILTKYNNQNLIKWGSLFITAILDAIQ